MRTPSISPVDRPRRLTGLALAMGLALAVTALTPTIAGAQDADIAVGTATDDLGTYLVGPEGMTLYTFTRDVTPGVSVCSGGCAEAWPPLLVAEGQALVGGEGVTGTLGAVPRDDGAMQATYRGRPLYYFASDAAAGETNGQAVGNVWFVATADGSMPADPPALTLQVAEADLETTARSGGRSPSPSLSENELISHVVGADGMTVYLFMNDVTPGVSTCAGDCLTAWPPVTVRAGNTAAGGEGATGVVGTIPTADGALQVTYNGWPLYYFSGDAAEGETNGQGVGDVWWVVAP